VRCFVGLWPDDSAAERLAAAARDLCRHNAAARVSSAPDLHLTLAFIGELPAEAGRPLGAELVDRFRAPSAWTVDHAGAFSRARVLWVAGASDPELGALAQAVRRCLSALHVPFDAKAFVPHITLARAFRPTFPLPRLLDAPVECHFAPPRLARSVAGASDKRYEFVIP
jgi:2'-5' RNA ligase